MPKLIDNLIVPSQYVSGERTIVQYPNFAAADVAKTFFVAPAPCKVLEVNGSHVTKAGQAGVLTIEKLTSGQAPSEGTEVLVTGGIDLTTNNGVPYSVAALTTSAATLAKGNALCLKLKSGAATSLAGATITVTIEWI